MAPTPNRSVCRHRITLFGAAALSAAVLFSTGCAQQQVEEKQFSGFLGDYSDFGKMEGGDGVVTAGWVSPEIHAADYTAIIIDPVVVYPPQETFERFDEADVARALDYLNQGLREELGQRYEIVSVPGPGVLRIRSALTTVEAGFKPLKWYNYVPVSAVAVAATEVTGVRDDAVSLIAEVELLDASTSKRLAAAARLGASSVPQDEPIEMKNVQPVLDEWVKAVGLWFDKYIKKS